MKNKLLSIKGSRLIGKEASKKILAGYWGSCDSSSDCPPEHSCVCGGCLSWIHDDAGCP